jgi:hypothetical protein
MQPPSAAAALIPSNSHQNSMRAHQALLVESVLLLVRPSTRVVKYSHSQVAVNGRLTDVGGISQLAGLGAGGMVGRSDDCDYLAVFGVVNVVLELCGDLEYT